MLFLIFPFFFFFFFSKLFFWQLYGSFIAAGFLFLRVSSVISRKIKIRGDYFRCCRWLLSLFHQEKYFFQYFFRWIFLFHFFFFNKKKRWFKSYSKVYRDFRGSLFFFFGFFKISKRREVEWEKRNVAELNPRARGLTVSSGPISSSKAFSLLPAPSSPCQSTCLSDFLRSATDFHRFFFPFIVKQPFFQNTVSHRCDDVCLFFDDENRIAFENNDT